MQVRWGRALGLIGLGACNTLSWRGGTPLPAVPPGDRRCWLLAATDDAALAISRQQRALRAAGWRVRTSDPTLVEALGNKVSLEHHFPRVGLG